MNLEDLHLHWGESNYKGKKYRSYSLALPYRKNGKNLKKSIIKLGKLSDEQVEKWQIILKAIKDPDCFFTTMKDISVVKHYEYLNLALINAIWNEWKFDNIFINDGKREVPIAIVARILTINHCIDPQAKSNIPEWFQQTSLPWLLDIKPSSINSSRIFRELYFIEKHKENICKHLFTQIRKNDPDSLESIFYDLSSSSFTGSKCVLIKYGLCKDGYKNHIVLALVVNRYGLPFYWEVLPGNTADSKTITWILESIKERFKIEKVTLTFDRGMVSDENLTTLEDEKIKYITAMDKNQIESITEFDFTCFSHLEPEIIDKQAEKLSKFKKLNNNTYYCEIKVEKKRRYILCFNPQLFKDQRKAREQTVEYFYDVVKILNEQLSKAKKSRQYKTTYKKFKVYLQKKKLKSFVDVNLEKKHIISKTSKGSKHKILTYQATVVVNNADMLNAGRLDGFWLLVTNHKEKSGDQFKMSASEVIKPYREKSVIESAFRDIKSFVEIEPVFVWTSIHIKAHYTICVLAYLINKTLSLKLHKNKGMKTKNIITHERLYKEISDCKIDQIEVKNVKEIGYNMTRHTEKQEELLKRVELLNLLNYKKDKKKEKV